MSKSITGTITPRHTVTGRIMQADRTGGLPYTGDYEIDPRKVAQVLSTRGKVMARNVDIKAILRSQVANLSGGDTITIGME